MLVEIRRERLLPALVICLGATQPQVWRVIRLVGLYSVTAFPLGMALRPPATLTLWLITGGLFARSMPRREGDRTVAGASTPTSRPVLAPVAVGVAIERALDARLRPYL